MNPLLKAASEIYHSPENQAWLKEYRAQKEAENAQKIAAGLVYRSRSNRWVRPRAPKHLAKEVPN